jgi:hypothetical protein
MKRRKCMTLCLSDMQAVVLPKKTKKNLATWRVAGETRRKLQIHCEMCWMA